MAVKIGNGPAQRFVRQGDVIVEINGIEIDTVADLTTALAENDGLWRIVINRGGRNSEARHRRLMSNLFQAAGMGRGRAASPC